MREGLIYTLALLYQGALILGPLLVACWVGSRFERPYGARPGWHAIAAGLATWVVLMFLADFVRYNAHAVIGQEAQMRSDD